VSAYDRWAKRHEDKQKQEAKQNAWDTSKEPQIINPKITWFGDRRL
jgi:hypothetical protein